MQYHSRNFAYMYFFKRVWFDTRMNSYTYEFIHVWNVPWNFSYVLQKEMVVFDLPIIVTSFKMGNTRGLPHSQNNVLT